MQIFHDKCFVREALNFSLTYFKVLIAQREPPVLVWDRQNGH